MQRILAIIEREMRRYLRSPALIFIALVLPLGQLIILGNSFGGKVQDVRLAMSSRVYVEKTTLIGDENDHVRRNT